jgi:hypothetical protein
VHEFIDGVGVEALPVLEELAVTAGGLVGGRAHDGVVLTSHGTDITEKKERRRRKGCHWCTSL